MEDFKKTPLWDSRLPIEVRLDYLISEMTMEEKLSCLGTGTPALPRFGIGEQFIGSEAAHGVEARHDQGQKRAPEPTTSFPQPIGMSASWDPELLCEAGEVVGKEARVLYQRNPVGGLFRWAPTVDMERDPRWGANRGRVWGGSISDRENGWCVRARDAGEPGAPYTDAGCSGADGEQGNGR